MAKKTEEVPVKPAAKSGGCLSVLSRVFVFTGVAALAVALVFVFIPQDLSNVDGYGPGSASPPFRDLKAVLSSSIERGYEVTFTEAEVNRYLAHTLATKQGGLLAKDVSLDGVWISLENDYAEIIMERRIFGHPFTISTYVQVIQTVDQKGGTETKMARHGLPYIEDIPPNRGGRFGRLVVPEGFLVLVMPSFEKVAALFHEEIDLGFTKMVRIKIKENSITFNPQEPTESLNPGGTF